MKQIQLQNQTLISQNPPDHTHKIPIFFCFFINNIEHLSLLRCISLPLPHANDFQPFQSSKIYCTVERMIVPSFLYKQDLFS